jgi:hypothetical protein
MANSGNRTTIRQAGIHSPDDGAPPGVRNATIVPDGSDVPVQAGPPADNYFSWPAARSPSARRTRRRDAALSAAYAQAAAPRPPVRTPQG